MADNTTLNQGLAGDQIRDIDRGGVKTQVVQIDAGGASKESLVSPTNPLPVQITDSFGIPAQIDNNGNLSVINNDAKTSDSPSFVAITGDPAGDWAGVNLLEQVMDDKSGIVVYL